MRRAIVVAILVAAIPCVAGAQRGFGRMREMLGDPNEYYVPPDFHGNAPYDGRFVFARIKYRGYAHFTNEGPGWSHDYPDAESHLMRIMQEITALRPFIQKGNILGGNIFALDDPELMKYPIAYFSEPGGWTPTESEVMGFRKYLQKGGFVIFDDFRGPNDWMNLTMQMKRVLPDARIMEVPATHPIFDSFFKIDLSLITPPYGGGRATWYGIFEGNDPTKRIIAILNFNDDIGEYWQWSATGFSPVPSNEAYKLGVNYLIYALTH